jgi:hypothetical protein
VLRLADGTICATADSIDLDERQFPDDSNDARGAEDDAT